MDNVVTVSAKKEFIRWFLSKFQLKKKEGTWLLNYMLSDERLLEKIHFTEDLRNKEKSIIISSVCSGATPFQFQKASKVYYDVERAFHDIRLNAGEEVYISVLFKDRMSHPEYLAVLEGNILEDQRVVQENVMSLVAEILIDQAIRRHRMKNLLQQIDEALAAGNKPLFLHLAEEWNELRKLEIDENG